MANSNKKSGIAFANRIPFLCSQAALLASCFTWLQAGRPKSPRLNKQWFNAEKPLRQWID
jgi:hypothetical protein